MARTPLVAAAAVLLLAGCQHPHIEQSLTGAKLFDGFDGYHRPIDTSSEKAQRWFDQGLQLAYGFNHAEAIRSFREAAALDPDSPMPWWGIAYSMGMNINDPVMTEERWRAAWQAAREAQRRAGSASAVETALVEAVVARYTWPPPAEQRTLDEAYAAAMERAWKAHPGDPDVGALYAESLMDLQPWDYWTNEGAPKGRIEEVVEVLETVQAAHPGHPGAAHFYIHAVEAAYPEKAEAAADRLADLVPGAGHIVHMPSHIYVRVGRYADAADINTRAVATDRAYFKTAPEPDLYWIYFAHNLHFLAYASMMEARYDSAIRAARELERDIPPHVVEKYGSLIEGIMATTFHVQVRFGRWEDILAEPPRSDARLVTQAVRHYARGIAYAVTGRIEEARSEVAAFESAAAAIPGDWWVFNNKVDTVLPIARAMLQGEVAFREGLHDSAFASLRRAVAAEDALVYDEPPAWMLPVRHSLGALLMSAGHFEEAERVYREDLERNAGNGWSILGLREALAAQGRTVEAMEVGSLLAGAWRRSDVTVTSSCFCAPGPLAK